MTLRKCAKCGKKFPLKRWEGEQIVQINRKKCLECFPYVKRIVRKPEEMGRRIIRSKK